MSAGPLSIFSGFTYYQAGLALQLPGFLCTSSRLPLYDGVDVKENQASGTPAGGMAPLGRDGVTRQARLAGRQANQVMWTIITRLPGPHQNN